MIKECNIMKKVISIEVAINENGNLVCMVNGSINTVDTGVKIRCIGNELRLKFSDAIFNEVNHNNWVEIPKFEGVHNEA